MQKETRKNETTQKEEALEHLSAIRDHLADKQIFFPYNYNATFVWSIIALLLTFIMVPIYESSIAMGTGMVFLLMLLGFIAEGVMTKKINKSYDIQDCTIRQRFIMKYFMMISLFLIVMSTILAMYQLYIPIYLTWLFMISVGYYAVGYVLNIGLFSNMAQFNVVLSMVLLAMAGYNDCLRGNDSYCFVLSQYAVLLGLAILPAIIAWHQKKEL